MAEIGGAWLVWQGVRQHRGLAFVGAGIVALAAYGFMATLQHDAHFGRILAAYGGIFVAGSLAWGMALDGFKPDRYDIAARQRTQPRTTLDEAGDLAIPSPGRHRPQSTPGTSTTS
jgi:small multidrug resistance family-3 protein